MDFKGWIVERGMRDYEKTGNCVTNTPHAIYDHDNGNVFATGKVITAHPTGQHYRHVYRSTCRATCYLLTDSLHTSGEPALNKYTSTPSQLYLLEQVMGEKRRPRPRLPLQVYRYSAFASWAKDPDRIRAHCELDDAEVQLERTTRRM